MDKKHISSALQAAKAWTTFVISPNWKNSFSIVLAFVTVIECSIFFFGIFNCMPFWLLLQIAHWTGHNCLVAFHLEFISFLFFFFYFFLSFKSFVVSRHADCQHCLFLPRLLKCNWMKTKLIFFPQSKCITIVIACSICCIREYMCGCYVFFLIYSFFLWSIQLLLFAVHAGFFFPFFLFRVFFFQAINHKNLFNLITDNTIPFNFTAAFSFCC